MSARRACATRAACACPRDTCPAVHRRASQNAAAVQEEHMMRSSCLSVWDAVLARSKLMDDFRAEAEAVGQCLHLNHMSAGNDVRLQGPRATESSRFWS